jgi:hypothetical protein
MGIWATDPNTKGNCDVHCHLSVNMERESDRQEAMRSCSTNPMDFAIKICLPLDSNSIEEKARSR